jgi:hypothetical protein
VVFTLQFEAYVGLRKLVRTILRAEPFKIAFECVHYAETNDAKFACKPLMEAMADCVRSNRHAESAPNGSLC